MKEEKVRPEILLVAAAVFGSPRLSVIPWLNHTGVSLDLRYVVVALFYC